MRRVQLEWPQRPSADLSREVYRVVSAVTELGGAVGWMTPPRATDVDTWLRSVLDAVGRGDAALCTASIAGQIAALGAWRRDVSGYMHHLAELIKIMAAPWARGRGLGAAVTGALVESAAAAGVETLTLGVRGNNHLAIELYEDLGFRVWGTLPKVIEVGDERYDDVRMFLELGRAPQVLPRGGSSGGPGSSPSRLGRAAS